MKVQFIFTNFDCPVGPSMGVSYISSALKEAGHETKCLHINEWVDYPYDPDRILKDTLEYDPDLVAMCFGTNHKPEALHICKILKEGGVRAKIFCGGIHTTLNTEEIISDPNVDFANVGEGDDSAVDLANALEKGLDTTNIPNIWAKKDGKIIQNPARPFKDISKLPFMDTEIWQYQKIMDSRRGWVNVYMNRGCPYRCTYCHNNGVAKIAQKNLGTKTSGNTDLGYLRLRDPQDMIDELKSLMSKYDVKAFSFNDDAFTMNKPQMMEFLPMYAKEIGLPFVCNTTVLDVDREILQAMADANCDLIRYGVETATERIRRHVLKRVFSTERTREVFAMTREVGIRSFAFLILGNPGETFPEMHDTLKLAAELQPDGLKVSIGYPFPGTEYYDIADEMGVIDHERNYHNFIRESKLNWNDEERVQLDKFRSVFWFWMNAHMDNDSSGPYKDLIKKVEAIGVDEWRHPSTEQKVLDMEELVAAELKKRNVTHWTIPFKDRPEITILVKGEDFLAYETLDQH